MTRFPFGALGAAAIAVSVSSLLPSRPAAAQGAFGQPPPPVSIDLKTRFDVPIADMKTEAIVASAKAFLATLSGPQREAAVYALTDNQQRSNWSNLPDGIVRRGGLRLGLLSDDQRTALDALLAEFMSEAGMRNIVYQLLAEDTLKRGGSGPNFGREFFYTSFVGEPSTTAPWMFQFGGHHLAINATVFGPNVSFSPMLTGGQPLHIDYEGRPLFITQWETAAAQAFMDSLNAEQRTAAIRGRRPINLLLGPGKYGTVVAPEGVRGGDLDADQQALLLDVIRARLSFINDDDAAPKMTTAESEIDATYFGWWGPEGTLGSAYFRVTAPSLVLEYSPQSLGGDPTDHVHNMYRNPANDYGVAWIGAGR